MKTFTFIFALIVTFSTFAYDLESIPLNMSPYSMGVVNSITVDDPSVLDSFLKSTSAPVLVEIYASWCPACKDMTPKLEEIAKKTGSFAYVIKADYEVVPQVASLFPFSKIPTMFFYKNGVQVVKPLVGSYPVFKVVQVLQSIK